MFGLIEMCRNGESSWQMNGSNRLAADKMCEKSVTNDEKFVTFQGKKGSKVPAWMAK